MVLFIIIISSIGIVYFYGSNIICSSLKGNQCYDIYQNISIITSYTNNNNINSISYYLNTYMISIDKDVILANINNTLLKECYTDNNDCKLDILFNESKTRICLTDESLTDDTTEPYMSSISYKEMLYMAGSLVSCIGGLFSVLLYFNNRRN